MENLDVIDSEYGQLRLVRSKYVDGGRVAYGLVCVEDSSPFTTVTTNIFGADLGPGEVIVRTWSENEIIRKPLLDSGVFRDTGRRVQAGFAEAEIWVYTGKHQ